MKTKLSTVIKFVTNKLNSLDSFLSTKSVTQPSKGKVTKKGKKK